MSEAETDQMQFVDNHHKRHSKGHRRRDDTLMEAETSEKAVVLVRSKNDNAKNAEKVAAQLAKLFDQPKVS